MKEYGEELVLVFLYHQLCNLEEISLRRLSEVVCKTMAS